MNIVLPSLNSKDINKLVSSHRNDLEELAKLLNRYDELVIKKDLTKEEQMEKERIFNHSIDIKMRSFIKSTPGFLTVNQARSSICKLARIVCNSKNENKK